MDASTSTDSPPPAALASSYRRISGGETNGLTWAVFADTSGDFLFATMAGTAPPFTSKADFKTAPKAERAAKEWCEAQTHAEPDTGDDAPAPAEFGGALLTQHRRVVAGWELTPAEEEGKGTYEIEFINTTTGEVGPESYRGYMSWVDGLAEASAWARETPCDGSPAPDEPASDEPAEWNSEEIVVPQEVVDHELAVDKILCGPLPSDRDAEIEQLRAERDLAIRQRDAALSCVADDVAAARAQAEESLALAERRDVIVATMETLKDELKFITTKLQHTSVGAMRAVASIGQGWQQRLTFAESAETRAVVGAAASKAASGQPPPAKHTWAFNGVEHTIEHVSHPCPDGEERWTTWLAGHRDTTEGHAFTYEAAVEATKSAASVVFADADPGSTSATPDAGAVADGPRTPAKRGRPAKLKGHDQAVVIAAVQKNLTIPEAALDLGCTPQQLEAFAKKNGIELTKHQGRKAGEELPAAPQAKAGKARGRKRGSRG